MHERGAVSTAASAIAPGASAFTAIARSTSLSGAVDCGVGGGVDHDVRRARRTARRTSSIRLEVDLLSAERRQLAERREVARSARPTCPSAPISRMRSGGGAARIGSAVFAAQQLQQVVAVTAGLERLRASARRRRGVDVAHPPGDLLGTGDLEALPLLDDAG